MEKESTNHKWRTTTWAVFEKDVQTEKNYFNCYDTVSILAWLAPSEILIDLRL